MRGTHAEKAGFSLTLALSACCAPAVAQSVSGAPVPPSQPTAGIEEVVVTARKREETEQSVPLTLNVISANTLAESHVSDFVEVARLVPDLNVHRQIGSSTQVSIYLRGFGTSTNDPNVEPSLPVFIDGVYQGSTVANLLEMFDMQRVEVLKGPQNVLLGKNSPAGALAFTTKRPTGDFDGTAQVDYSRFNRVEERLLVDFPLINGVLAGKVSVYGTTGGDYIRNVSIPGRSDTGGEDTYAVRAGILYTPNDQIDWYVSGDFRNQHLHPFADRNVSTANAYPTQPASLSCVAFKFCNAYPTPNTTGNEFDGRSTVKVESLTSTFDWKPGFAALTAISSYRHTINTAEDGIGGLPIVIIDANYVDDNVTEWGQEVRLASISGGAFTFDNRLDWILGMNYYHNLFSQHRDLNILDTIKFTDSNNGDSKSSAAFLSGTYHFTDSWNLTVGGRYTYDDKKHNFLAPGSAVPIYQRATFNNFSPESTLQYEFDKERMVYARFAEGYRGGGFDGQPLATNLAPYRSETVRSYEVGAKTQWLDDRVRINAAVYRSNYSDLQRTVSIQGSTLITQNAASARIQGAEVESIFLATQHLKLNLSGGYLDAHYRDFFADVLGTGIPMDLSHMRFPFSARWSGNAGAEYDIPIGDAGTVVCNLNYGYQASQNLNVVDSPEATQGPYGLLGASLTFNGPGDRYHVSAYGKNILDKQYRVDFEPVSGLASTVIDGMPATWGISVGAKF